MKKQILILLLLLSSAISNATIYYVSSSGSDSNNGTSIATPFLTLSKVNSLTLVAGDQILFKKGDTFYGTITNNESGSIGNYITYGAYGTGNNPIISGFTSVTSWTNLGSNIWESTNAVSTLTTCNMVAVNGVNTAMGRWPNGTQNDGYLNVDSKTATSITSSGLSSSSVTDWTGAQVLTRPGMFTVSKATVTSQSGTTINFSSISSATNYGFFIQNDERTLDTQNEWYYNPTSKKLRIYSTSQPSGVKVSSVETLLFAYGNYLKFENISFEGSNSYMVYNWEHSPRWHHISFNSCSFKNAGAQFIYTLTHYLTADNCTFNYSNAGGLFLTFGNGCSVTNSTIENILQFPGMIPNGYTGAVQTSVAKRLLVQYCDIKNIGYAAVSFYGDSTEVKNNFIDTYCNVLDDGGAIYTYVGNRVSTYGNKINYNVIVNGVGAQGGMSAVSSIRGIYLDLNSCNVEIGYNSVYKAKLAGIFHNSRKNINVHHNTVMDGGKLSFYAVTSGEYTDSVVTGNKLNNNIFVCRHVTDQTNEYSEERCVEYSYWTYPDNVGSISYLLNSIAEQDYNAYWRMTFDNKVIRRNGDGTSAFQETLSQWQATSGKDTHSFYPTKAISDSTQVKMYYNATKVAKTINIWQPGVDANNVGYSSPITIQPYSSIVIVRDSSTGTYYYVSSSTGNDSNSGSESYPWSSLTKVNNASLVAKDRVLFKSGDSWYGQLLPKSGSALGDVIYSSYGTGTKKPLIHASSIITNALNWTNYSGNIWKNSDPTLSNTELLTNATDAANFSSILYQANSPGAGTKTIDTGIYHTGTNSIKIACTGTGNVANSMYLQYTGSFAMSAGKSYEFSFWTYGTSSGQIDEAWALTTSWGEIDKLQSAKTFSATTWTKMTYRFTAQNDYTACMFLVRFGLGVTSGNSIYFDDFSFKEITGFYPNIEVCNLIFNNDRSFGKRRWSTGTLANQGDWYWDSANKVLYLYSNSIPSNVYQSIRTVNKLNLISASSKSYITIDGLALKYGDYGFVGSGTDHITIKNCDIAYIGGSDAGSPVRKGNGIEFWASNSNALVQNNKIWECFDAGITSQSSVVSTVISNMTFKNNQVWNCEYGYEYFNTGSGSSTSNILVENNTFYNSGAGWGHSQRSDPTGYSIRLANRTEATHSNFIIRNNIFSNSTAECQHNWDTTHNLYTINNNLYYQPTGNIVGINFTTYYTQAQFSTYKSATGWDANSLIGDPKFIGKDIGNFRLLPTSPARKVGYQGLDIGAFPYTNSTISKTGIFNGKLYAL